MVHVWLPPSSRQTTTPGSPRKAKSDKDVFQACVLCAALAESHPGAIESAVAQIPRRAKKYLTPAVEAARRFLESAHRRAWEELSGTAAGEL